jgi:hypothetical protein
MLGRRVTHQLDMRGALDRPELLQLQRPREHCVGFDNGRVEVGRGDITKIGAATSAMRSTGRSSRECAWMTRRMRVLWRGVSNQPAGPR